MTPIEEQAIMMLKRRNYQPSEIARITGASQLWVELKAEAMGYRPLTVDGVRNGK